jgi:crossover junction endodeoxyribonuclease RuvC
MAKKGTKKKNIVQVSMTKPKFILALDMSLTGTGWSIYDAETGAHTKGRFDTSELRGLERLRFLRDRVLYLAWYGHLNGPFDGLMSPDKKLELLVFIEGYAFGARGASIIDLGELGGVIRLGLADLKIPYVEVTPTQIKKFVCGAGNANKNVVLKEVFKRFGEDINDDNIADAFSLMQLGRAACGFFGQAMVKFQADVVGDVMKTYFKGAA